MPDTQTADQGTDNSQDAGADSQAGADTNNTDTGNAGAGDAGDAKDGQSGGDNAKNGGETAPKDQTDGKDTQGDNTDDNSEPEVKARRSVKDFIIQRQQRKIERLKGKTGDQDTGDDDTGDDAKTGDGEIAPEDEELITKVVAKQFAPVIEKSLAAEDDAEVNDFVAKNPDFKPFEAKARRFMQHPSRRNLPVKSIFYEVAGDALLTIGAKRQKEADEKARQTQTGGGSNRGTEGGTKSAFELSQDEFHAKQEEIRRSQRT